MNISCSQCRRAANAIVDQWINLHTSPLDLRWRKLARSLRDVFANIDSIVVAVLVATLIEHWKAMHMTPRDLLAERTRRFSACL